MRCGGRVLGFRVSRSTCRAAWRARDFAPKMAYQATSAVSRICSDDSRMSTPKQPARAQALVKLLRIHNKNRPVSPVRNPRRVVARTALHDVATPVQVWHHSQKMGVPHRGAVCCDVAVADEDLALLRSLVAVTVGGADEDFFRRLVRDLAKTLLAPHAFVAEFIPPARTRTLALWSHGGFIDNVECEPPAASGEDAIRAGIAHIFACAGLPFRRPEPGIEAPRGVPLRGSDGSLLGHLYVSDDTPQRADPALRVIFGCSSSSRPAKVQRQRLERSLRGKRRAVP